MTGTVDRICTETPTEIKLQEQWKTFVRKQTPITHTIQITVRAISHTHTFHIYNILYN